MLNMLKFQFSRALESKKLFLTLALLVLIAIGGFVMFSAFSPDSEDPLGGMSSLFNAFTQFFFLILAYVIISLFSDDNQSGAIILFKYMGYSGIKVTLSKILYCILLFLPVSDLVVLFGAVVYECDDFEFIVRLLILLDLSIIQVVMIASAISAFFKKTSTATILMYGSYLFLDVVNLLAYGVTNQADGNSLTTYYMAVASGSPLDHYSSWTGIGDYTNEQLFAFSILLNIVWIVVLFIITLIKAKRIR